MRFIPFAQVALVTSLFVATSVTSADMSEAEAERKITKLWAKPTPTVNLKLDRREQKELSDFVLDLVATDDPLKAALEESVRLRALTVPRVTTDYHINHRLPAKSPPEILGELAEMAAIFLNRAIEHTKQGREPEATTALADFLRVLIQARVLATVTLGHQREIFARTNNRNLILVAFTAPVTIAFTLLSTVNQRPETFALLAASALATSAIGILLYGDSELEARGAPRPWLVLPTTLNRHRRKVSAELFDKFHEQLGQRTEWIPPKGFSPAQIRAACALYLENT